MKWILQFLCIGLLAACTEISYKEPQPKGIKSLDKVPAKLQGSYQVSENGAVADTLLIIPTGYLIGKDELASLSDSLVLKYYKGYYFLSMRDNFAWYIRVIKQEKNGNINFLEMDGPSGNDEEITKFIEKLSKDVRVAETEIDNKTCYVIDPTPKELLGLIKKGYFKQQTFTRLN